MCPRSENSDLISTSERMGFLVLSDSIRGMRYNFKSNKGNHVRHGQRIVKEPNNGGFFLEKKTKNHDPLRMDLNRSNDIDPF